MRLTLNRARTDQNESESHRHKSTITKSLFYTRVDPSKRFEAFIIETCQVTQIQNRNRAKLKQ